MLTIDSPGDLFSRCDDLFLKLIPLERCKDTQKFGIRTFASLQSNLGFRIRDLGIGVSSSLLQPMSPMFLCGKIS
jgi:hypothetical protein